MALTHTGLQPPRRSSPENDDVYFLRTRAQDAQAALTSLRRSLPQKIAAATQELCAERDLLYQRLQQQKQEGRALLTRCAEKEEQHKSALRSLAKTRQQLRQATVSLERKERELIEARTRAMQTTPQVLARPAAACASAAVTRPPDPRPDPHHICLRCSAATDLQSVPAQRKSRSASVSSTRFVSHLQRQLRTAQQNINDACASSDRVTRRMISRYVLAWQQEADKVLEEWLQHSKEQQGEQQAQLKYMERQLHRATESLRKTDSLGKLDHRRRDRMHHDRHQEQHTVSDEEVTKLQKKLCRAKARIRDLEHAHTQMHAEHSKGIAYDNSQSVRERLPPPPDALRDLCAENRNPDGELREDHELKQQWLLLAESKANLSRAQSQARVSQKASKVAEAQLQKQKRKYAALQESTRAAALERESSIKHLKVRERELSEQLRALKAKGRHKSRAPTIDKRARGCQTEAQYFADLASDRVTRETQTVDVTDTTLQCGAQMGASLETEREPEPELESVTEIAQYAICFETADVRGAGSSADVCLQLVSHDGERSRTLLFPNAGAHFKRGTSCWFKVEAPAALWSKTTGLPLAQITVGHDLCAEQTDRIGAAVSPFGNGQWLLQAVHVQCSVDPDNSVSFWCGDAWFDSSDEGGVLRSFPAVTTSTIKSCRTRSTPIRPRCVSSAAMVSRAPAAKSVTFLESTTNADDVERYFVTTVYCRAVSCAAAMGVQKAQVAKLSLTLHGTRADSSGGTLCSTNTVTTDIQCRLMDSIVLGRRSESVRKIVSSAHDTHAFRGWTNSDHSVDSSDPVQVPAESGNEQVRQQITASSLWAQFGPGDSVETLVDDIITSAVAIATESNRVAGWALGLALEAAVAQVVEPQSIAEEVLEEVFDEAVSQMHTQKAVGAVQRLSLPPVGWDDGDDNFRRVDDTRAHIEPHTIELAELSGVVGGNGAWIWIQGVEVIDIGSGRGWWFSGNGWLPQAKRGHHSQVLPNPLCLRRQVNNLGELLADGNE